LTNQFLRKIHSERRIQITAPTATFQQQKTNKVNKTTKVSTLKCETEVSATSSQ